MKAFKELHVPGNGNVVRNDVECGSLPRQAKRRWKVFADSSNCRTAEFVEDDFSRWYNIFMEKMGHLSPFCIVFMLVCNSGGTLPRTVLGSSDFVTDYDRTLFIVREEEKLGIRGEPIVLAGRERPASSVFLAPSEGIGLKHHSVSRLINVLFGKMPHPTALPPPIWRICLPPHPLGKIHLRPLLDLSLFAYRMLRPLNRTAERRGRTAPS